VLGQTSSSAVNASGVSGTISSSADYAAGVRGQNFHTACCGFGVVGFHAGQGIGIGGYAPNGFGVFGYSPYNWAAWLDGAVTINKDLHVTGTLYKGAGAFRIDNPLDPAHSYLFDGEGRARRARVEFERVRGSSPGVGSSDRALREK
jgi:hypothetical protein